MAWQLAIGLQRRGFDPEQLYFPNEGHGMALLENRILFWQRVVRFLDRHIGEAREYEATQAAAPAR